MYKIGHPNTSEVTCRSDIEVEKESFIDHSPMAFRKMAMWMIYSVAGVVAETGTDGGGGAGVRALGGAGAKTTVKIYVQ